MHEERRPDTRGDGTPFVTMIDDIQYGLGEGPCISAAATGQTRRSGPQGADPVGPGSIPGPGAFRSAQRAKPSSGTLVAIVDAAPVSRWPVATGARPAG